MYTKSNVMGLAEAKRENESSAIRKGVINTLVIMGILFLSFQFWFATPIGFPEIGKKEFRIVTTFDFTAGTGGGKMDYGTDWKGSGKVNNFEDPSPNPGDAPANNSNSNPPPTLEPNANPTLTGNDQTGVQANNGSKPRPKVDPNSTYTTGGSNDGPGNEVGNWGDPNYHQLNSNGNYSWGPGGAGLGNRKWLALPPPQYTVNEESKITFEFTIAPSGDVLSVKRPISSKADLVRAGMEAIKTWKFEPVDPDKGNQSVKVTIVFRLQ